MPTTEIHKLVLVKPSKRGLGIKGRESNMTAILAATNNKSLAVMGWTVERDTSEFKDGFNAIKWNAATQAEYGLADIVPAEAMTGNEYINEMHVLVSFEHATKKPDHNAFNGILRKLAGKAKQPLHGNWVLLRVDGQPWSLEGGVEDGNGGESDALVSTAEIEIPANYMKPFQDKLYGLDDHVETVFDALRAYLNSNGRHRNNIALVGPPACGKSEVALTLKEMFGEDAVMAFDATAMTPAGFIKELSEREILPAIIVFEEMEKTNEGSLDPLMALCDVRAEIRKTTARTNIQRDCKVLAVCTVNNEKQFDKLRSGALGSRFKNRIYFSRPSRDVRAMILKREIDAIKGDERWIAPVLDYCEEMGIDDPRDIISKCTTYAGKWLVKNKEYGSEARRMLAATAKRPDPDAVELDEDMWLEEDE